jgi:hypothetical protein
LAIVGLVAWLVLFTSAVRATLEAQRTNHLNPLPSLLAAAALVVISLSSIPAVHQKLPRHGLAWLGFFVLLWPIPLWGPPPLPEDYHRVSFCIAPALYKYGPGLVPAIDIFSQYGAGQGFFFSFFLGDTAASTLRNYHLLFLSVCLGFFVSAYHFLTRLLRSRAWAFGVCTLAVLYQFYLFGDPLNRWFAFSIAPSLGVYRMPLLILVVWLFTRLCQAGFHLGGAVLLGSVLGLSIFWSTDTGTALLAACGCATLALGLPVLSSFCACAVLGASAVGTFFGLSLAAYGLRVLTPSYLNGVLGPWLWYAGEGHFQLQGYPWDFDSGYFFTLVAFVWTIIVAAWLSRRRRTISFTRASLVCLAFVSLFLYAKYVPLLQYIYWAGTALPALAVVAWGLKEVLPNLYTRLLSSASFQGLSSGLGRMLPKALAAVTAVAFAACLLGGVEGYPQSGPTMYGLRPYAQYGSVLNTTIKWALFNEAAQWTSPPPDLCSASDIALIQKHTQPGERTPLLSYVDWAFLIDAKRPPRYFFLPLLTASDVPFYYEEMRQITFESKVVFFDKRNAQELLERLNLPLLDDFLDWTEEADNLVLYRQRPPGVPTSAGLIYHPGTRIDFTQSSCRPYLRGTWTGPEGWGRWSGETADIKFRLERAHPLRLRMMGTTNGQQRIVVSLNETEITTLQGSGGEPELFEVDLPQDKVAECNTLRLTLPDATSPQSLGKGEDPRILGVGVVWIEFVPLAEKREAAR